MNRITRTSIAVIATAVTAGAWAQPGNGTDQVMASFERDLAHRPGPASVVTREQIGEDLLYRIVNGTRQGTDNLHSSFERAFSREETAPLPGGGDASDELTARFNDMLWSQDSEPSAR